MVRQDIDTTTPSLTIRFNEKVHSESEVRAIVEILKPYVRTQAAKEYAFSVELAITATVLIGVPLYFFSKGFFSRIGERLGDEVGSDAVAAYRRLKEAVSRLLTNKAVGKKAALRFELVSDRGLPEIHAKVESSGEQDFQQAFDQLEELAATAKKDSDDIKQALGQDVVTAHYRYEPETSTWVLTWASTDKGRFVSVVDS